MRETPFPADDETLKRYLARSPTRDDPHFARWVAGRLVGNLFLGFAVCVLLPALIDGDPAQAARFSGALAWVRLSFAVVLALILTGMMARSVRRSQQVAAADILRDMHRNWEQLTGRSWIWRAIVYGVILGLGIGVSVGGFLASTSSTTELTASGRALAILVFTGLTLLWTIPTAFAFRWLLVWRFRRTLRQIDAECGGTSHA